MKKFIAFILFMVLPLIGGKISSVLSGDIKYAYAQIIQPEFSPPTIVFPIVWTILFLLMGYSSWRVYTKCLSKNINPEYCMRPYGLQLALNYVWSPIFFGMGAYMLGAWCAVALLAAIIFMAIRFAVVDKLSAWLQVPYILWVTFACYLSFGVAYLN